MVYKFVSYKVKRNQDCYIFHP